MQLVVFQLVSGAVKDVIRHVYDSIKKAWSETGRAKKGELLLHPVAIKERNHRTRVNQD